MAHHAAIVEETAPFPGQIDIAQLNLCVRFIPPIRNLGRQTRRHTR